ncbi:MAG TPA: AraC family transcriptional regulator, partial [Rhodospirillaceae bacterium]|nr:AraC family transcriptional regulator [Rhodospirillaceae bacterium]
MQIAVLTFDGFNELDSFIAAGILNRMRPQGWKAFITCPSETVTSMNGVTVQAEKPLEFATQA